MATDREDRGDAQVQRAQSKGKLFYPSMVPISNALLCFPHLIHYVTESIVPKRLIPGRCSDMGSCVRCR